MLLNMPILASSTFKFLMMISESLDPYSYKTNLFMKYISVCFSNQKHVRYNSYFIFQPTPLLRPNADPHVHFPRGGDKPRALDRGDITLGLPVEAAGRDRPHRDGRHQAHQQAPAQTHSA